jgi:hypothetical protein
MQETKKTSLALAEPNQIVRTAQKAPGVGKIN